MYSKFICSAAAILTFSCQSFAISSGGYVLPTDANVIQSSGSAQKTELPRKFNLLDWNIQKAKQGEVWANDFVRLQKNYDLVLIQEAISDSIFQKAVSEKPNTLSNYFVSWIRIKDQSSSGLMTSSQVKPTSTTYTRTTDVEPVISTPKLTSYETFKVQGLKNAELLVINIHAINFVAIDKFQRHIEQVMAKVDAHAGPVIFIGDMNTWNAARLKILKDMTSKRNLTWYDFPRPTVSGVHSNLDHAFVRGLKVNYLKSLTEIVSSDHFPLVGEFEVQ